MKNRKINLIYIGVVLLGIIIVAFSYFDTKTNAGDWNPQNFISYNNWTLTYESNNIPVVLPFYSEETTSHQMTLSNTLPDDLTDYNTLAFANNHQGVRVFIDNSLVYEFNNKNSRFFPVPASLWNFIELNDSYAGKEVKIELTSYLERHSKNISNILLGEKDSIILYIFKSNLFGLISCIIMFAMSLFLFIYWLVTKRLFQSNSMLYLSLFALHVMLWSLMETHVIQFFVHNPTTISTFTAETLLLNGLPIFLYFREDANPKVKKLSEYLLYYGVLNFFVCNLLHFTHILPLEGFISFIHINYALSSFALLYANIVSLKHRKKKLFRNPVFYGFIILITSIIIDITCYYHSISKDNARFTRIGLMIYIMILCVNTVKHSLDIIVLGHKAKVYEHLAYHDILTELLNRAAIEEELNKLNKSKEKCLNIMIMMFDLNDLKLINDSLGHSAGDQYIIANVNFILYTFNNIGTLYRTGGDKFTMIIKNYEEDKFRLCLNHMLENMDSKNPIPRKRINFAYGYAVFEPDRDNTLHDTIQRADANMYKKKYEMKGHNIR